MDATIRLLRDLVAINSVNPTLVRRRARRARRSPTRSPPRCAGIGLDVSIEAVAPGRPNVVGVLEGARPGRTLMFCGHTDTVGVTGMNDPFTPVERDGRLYGRGAQDMKGGVAAMIDAAALVARARSRVRPPRRRRRRRRRAFEHRRRRARDQTWRADAARRHRADRSRDRRRSQGIRVGCRSTWRGRPRTAAVPPKGRTRFCASAACSRGSKRSTASCRRGRRIRWSAPGRCTRRSIEGGRE